MDGLHARQRVLLLEERPPVPGSGEGAGRLSPHAHSLLGAGTPSRIRSGDSRSAARRVGSTIQRMCRAERRERYRAHGRARDVRRGTASGPRRRDRDVIMGQRCMEHAYLAQPTRSWGLVLVLVTLTGRHDSPPRHPSIRVGGPVIGSPMVSRSSTTVVSPGLTVTVASGSLASL